MVVIGKKRFYTGKKTVLGHSGCILDNKVVFGQEWLLSDKSGCIWARWL